MPRQVSKVWDYYEVINTDGKKSARCNFCRIHLSTNATKLKNHLKNTCKKCPEDVKAALQDETPQVPNFSFSTPCPVASTSTQLPGQMIPVPSPSPSGGSNSLSSTAISQESSFNDHHSESGLTPEQKKEIDLGFARAIYATGAPFNLLESSFWQKAITALNPGYSVPTRYMISNSLLDLEYERIRKESSQVINQAEALALVMDGWSDINGKGTVNFIITTPKPFFFKSVYPGTNRETSTFLFTQLKAIIDEVGPSKFVAVVTDNTNNMKAMWRMVELEYAHVFAVGCASHTMNLLIKDIMKLDKFKICNEVVTKIIKYIKKRHVELAYFEKIQKEKYGNTTKSLKLPSQTRWGCCVIIYMESFICNREALEATAICQVLNFNRELKQHLLTEDLWINVTAFHNILNPIFVATTKLESDKAMLSEVPEMFEYVRENVSKALSSCEVLNEDEEIYIIEAIRKRQHFVEKPIHFAANILDPRHRGLKLTPEKVAEGQEFIYHYAETQNKNSGKIMTNLAEYRAKSNFYSQAGIWIAANQIEPTTWWKGLCNCEIISSIARKLLSVPPSSASSERNWSLFGNTLTRPRNRISTDRLQKLITVRSNIRLLSENPLDNVYVGEEENINYSSSSEEEENAREVGIDEQEMVHHNNLSETEKSVENDPLI